MSSIIQILLAFGKQLNTHNSIPGSADLRDENGCERDEFFVATYFFGPGGAGFEKGIREVHFLDTFSKLLVFRMPSRGDLKTTFCRIK